MIAVVFIFAIFIGRLTSSILPDALSFVGWAVGFGSLYFGAKHMNKAYEKRAIFKRKYQTK